MEKLLHILDLDNTLIKVDAEPWIIKKTEPNIPIIRLKAGQRKLIEAESFKREDLLIKYSGKEYWLSKDIYAELEKKTKKDVNLKDYGLSYAEFFDPELIKLQLNTLELCSYNLDHLKNTKDDVIIVTERSGSELHSSVIELTKEKLLNLNINVSNVYMICKNNLKTDIDDIAYNKELLVLEKLIGYKIIDDQFSTIETNQYNKIHFYDDDRKCCEELKTIQETFCKIYFKTSDQIKTIILNKVMASKPFLKICQVTNNEFNKFIIDSVQLDRPTRVHKFNYFK